MDRVPTRTVERLLGVKANASDVDRLGAVRAWADEQRAAFEQIIGPLDNGAS